MDFSTVVSRGWVLRFTVFMAFRSTIFMAMVLSVVFFYTTVIRSAVVPVVLMFVVLMVKAMEFVAAALTVVELEL